MLRVVVHTKIDPNKATLRLLTLPAFAGKMPVGKSIGMHLVRKFYSTSGAVVTFSLFRI